MATVKGYGRPFRVLIDSGASTYYARRQSIAENPHLYGAACAEKNGDIHVRLATGMIVTQKKIEVDLRIQFSDFDFTERFSVIDMDDRYDLILGYAWLEDHEPWIDWKTRQIANSSPGRGHTFGLHDPTVAVSQRRNFAIEDRAHYVGVCDIIGRSQRDKKVVFARPLVSQFIAPVAVSTVEAHAPVVTPAVEAHAPIIIVEAHAPVAVPTVEAPAPAVDPAVEAPAPAVSSAVEAIAPAVDTAVEAHRSAPTVLSVVEANAPGVEPPVEAVAPVGNPTVVAPPRSTSSVDVSALHILDAVTGRVVSPSCVDVAPLPEVSTLASLTEVSYPRFLRELKRGEYAEVVFMRSPAEVDEELNASSVMDPSVLDDFRQRFEARRGAVILQNPKDPYYPLVSKYSKSCLNPTLPSGLPPDRGVRHEIEVEPGSGYLVLRQWPLPAEQSEYIDAFFAEKQRQGWVRESKSPHSAPTFCVRKPNGKWRIVHAYNKLNAKTVPARTPIPRKDVIVNKMGGCKRFSVVDLVDGYYQVLMELASVPFTAVSTPSGMLWEWLVMPQGLSNAPATFNRLVTHLFRPLREFASTYFDDIFVHTQPDPGEDIDATHLRHLDRVLACMAEHQLYANLDKCIFGAEEIPVLGCYVGVDGVRADPDKVKTIAKWPAPTSQKDLHKWLGLANYLHRYTPNYAEMARPLSDLLKMDCEWDWTPECAAAFAEIKASLQQAPILALPDDSRPFSVVCDASDYAIGCALLGPRSCHFLPIQAAEGCRTELSGTRQGVVGDEVRLGEVSCPPLGLQAICDLYRSRITAHGHPKSTFITTHGALVVILCRIQLYGGVQTRQAECVSGCFVSETRL